MQKANSKEYFSLCGVRFCSSVVLWLDFILIFSTLTFVFDAPAKTLALAATLYGIPALLFGPYLGSLADRYDPRLIITISFGIRFFAACALFFAPTVEVFLAFIALKGLSNLGSTAAEIVLTKSLLTTSQIVKNTSIVTIMDQSIKVLSPIIAGFMTSLTVKSAGFLVSAAFCVVGLLCIATLIQTKPNIVRSIKSERTSRRFIFSYFRRHTTAKIFLLCVLIQSAALGLYDSLLGLFLKNHGEDAKSFGIIVSATAVGGICSGLAFPKLYTKKNRHCSTIASTCFGVSLCAVGIVSFFPYFFSISLLSSLFFIAGFAYGLTSQGFTATLQLTCTANRLGATFATTRTLSIALFISFPVLGGWLAEISSTAYVLISAGSLTTLFACVLHSVYTNKQVNLTSGPQRA